MKRLSMIAIAASLACSPALAQNAGQIARVRSGASCQGCNLFQADLTGLEVKDLNLSKSRLRQATLTAAVMNRVRFDRADLRDVDAAAAVFSRSSFVSADLTNANFVGSYLQGANLSGARLTGAVFSGAEMDRAVGLTQAQLNQACGDDSTRLPRGMHIPAC